MSNDGTVRFNPFTEQVGTRYFVGREDQLDAVDRTLEGLSKRTPNHFFIAGLHGTGKTSFLVKVKESAESKGFIAPLATMDEKHSAYDQVTTILTALVESVDARMNASGVRGPLFNDWLAERPSIFLHPRAAALKSDAIKRDLTHIQRVMEDLKIPGALLCIDEGQRIVPAALSAVKNAVQHVQRFLVAPSLRVATDAHGVLPAGRAVLDAKAAEAEGDFGASRMFVIGIPMGPFDTEDEAARCIKKRLEKNVIRFSDKVIIRICRMTGRVPRDMIELSSSLYEDAASGGVEVVELPLLQQTFVAKYRLQMSEAMALTSELPEAARSVLSAIVAIGHATTASEIAGKLYPNVGPDTLTHVLAGVRADLRRIVDHSRVVVNADDKFEVVSPVHAFALHIALGGE